MRSGIFKKISILGIVFLFIGASIVPSINSVKNISKKNDSNTMIFHFNFDEPVVEEIELFGRLYHKITIDDSLNYDKPGEPVLPIKPVVILLPSNKEFYSLEVITGTETALPGNYNIMPGQQSVPLSFSKEVTFTEQDQVIYESSNAYPTSRHEIVSIQRSHGFKLLIINFFPINYIPKTGEIKFIKTITLKVHLSSGCLRSYSSRPCRMISQDIIAVQKRIENPEHIDTYSIQNSYSSTDSLFVDSSEQYDYVIITNENLRDANGEYSFYDLIQSKIDKGLAATIVTVEEIEACPEYWWDGLFGDQNSLFNDTACHIRNFIKDAYENWGTEYVLLGGDGDGADVGGESGDLIIPAREFSGILWPDFQIATDLYYACLDGSFDSNLNGIFGEIGDGYDIDPVAGEVDLMAEVYIGRAPVDNQQELSNFVRKTLAYEQSNDPYLHNVLMVGEYSGFGDPYNWGGDMKDEIINGSSAFGYITEGIPSEYDVNTLYDRCWEEMGWPEPQFGGFYVTGGWPKEEIISVINNGVHIINHIGHGGNTHIMKLDEPVSIVWESGEILGECHDIQNLTNDHYFFGYSFTCFAGSFDNYDHPGSGLGEDYLPYDSIVETLVTSEHGAFAFIANTRIGIGAPNTDAPSLRFDREFFDALFGENIRNLGKAHQDSKEDTIYVISNFLIRFCYYELTLFGDPEIAINSPPDTPATPSGPIWGLPNQPYTYTTSTTDPDGDQVYYTWDWGDGNFSDWLGPYVSGLIAGASHTWTDIGMYNVRVKAKDVFYAESNWSEPLSVAIAIPGDLDFDGDVDILDLLQLLANCGTTEGATYEEGDIDSDGDVDLADLAALLGNYGTGT